MKEQEQSKTLVEKGIWWGKVGGIVAAAVGVVRHMSELAAGGVVLTASAIVGERILFKRKQQPAG